MRAVFISYDGLSDALGGSQILPYVLGLKEAGFHYSIISFEKEARFKSHGVEIGRMLEEKKIAWFPKKYTKKPALLSTMYDIMIMRRSIKKVIQLESPDVLHCRSYVSMFAAFPLAKKHHLKLVFDMRGFWIDERVEGSIWDIKNPIYAFLYKYLKKKEKLWFQQCDKIISLTEAGKSIITKSFMVPENKIQVIPCCADPAHFNFSSVSEDRRKELKKKLNIGDNEKILVYSGSLGTWYLADEMLRQFDQLEKTGLVHKFLWLTNESSDIIQVLGQKANILPSKLIVCQVQRKHMPLYLSLADLGIFYIKPSFSKSASSPTKLAELLLMGIPVICNAGVGDLDNFFSRYSIGVCHDLSSEWKIDSSTIENLLIKDKQEIRDVGIQELGLFSGIEKYKLALSHIA